MTCFAEGLQRDQLLRDGDKQVATEGLDLVICSKQSKQCPWEGVVVIILSKQNKIGDGQIRSESSGKTKYSW